MPEQASQIAAAVDEGQAALSTVATVLDGVATVLNVISAFAVSDVNAARAISLALVALIDSLIMDVLQNNVGLCLHLNLEWDPDWTYDESWLENSQLPWKARGVTNWLADVAASTRDESDPLRPLTDDDTYVGGFILLQGVSSHEELEDLKALFDMFTNMSAFRETLDTYDRLGNVTEANKPLTRLGPAMASSLMHALVCDPEQEGAAVLEQIGATTVEDFLPLRGNYPKWASLPMAATVPAMKQLIDKLRQLRESIKPSLDKAEQIALLASLIANKAALLSDSLDEVGELLESIESLIAFLRSGNVHFIWIPDDEPGGMANFINRAVTAENLPDFGSDGIVVGVVGIVTGDDMANHMQRFWEMLGLQADAFVTGTDTLAANIDAAFADIFPE